MEEKKSKKSVLRTCRNTVLGLLAVWLIFQVARYLMIEEMPQDKIIAVSDYENHAWGDQKTGCFVDTDGNVYTYDLSNESCLAEKTGVSLSLLEKLYLIRENADPCATLPQNLTHKIYKHGMQINPLAVPLRVGSACDAGLSGFFFVNPTNDEMILCNEEGDTSAIVLDIHALAITNLFSGMLSEITMPEEDRSTFCSKSDILIQEIPCSNIQKNEKYIIFSKEQLKRQADLHGLDISETISFVEESEYQDYVYMIQFDKEELKRVNGILYQHGKLDFAFSKEVNKEQQKGGCYIAIYPNNPYLFFSNSYEDSNGNPWILPPEDSILADPLTYRTIIDGVSDKGLQDVYKKYDVNNSKLIVISTQGEYMDFISSCDEMEICEDEGSILERLGNSYQPDFDKVTLYVWAFSTCANEEIETGRITVKGDSVETGIRIRRNGPYDCDNPGGECYLAFTYIPKNYLQTFFGKL